MAARRTPPGVLGGTTGMSDRVRLGGGGTLKTNARVVLRARIEPDPNDDQLDRYWVGRYFDAFDGREWKGSGQEQPPRARVQVRPLSGRYLMQRIELLPGYESRTLVGLDSPVIFEAATVIGTSGASGVQLVEVTDEEVHFAAAGNAYTYSASSKPPTGGEVDAVDEKYLALPKAIDPRIAGLAKQIIGNETNPLQVGRRLESYLRTNYAYTLDLPGELEDPLADFLFVRKAGHCEHFATALAVLLRTQGVASRVTAGFFGGERVSDRYVVRAGDAHAWVQVFVPTSGWVTLDATPDSGRRNNSSVLLATITTWYERVEQLWQSRVIDYSIQDQVQIVRALVRPPEEASQSSFSLSKVPKKALLASVLTAFVVLLALRILMRPVRKGPHPLASFLDDIELRLDRAKVMREPGEGLEELATRLERTAHPLARPVGVASKRYLEARFGSRALTKQERTKLLAALAKPSLPKV